MPSITLLLTKLKKAYPTIAFQPADDFHWSSDHQTVYYNAHEDGAIALLLHELSHGLLGHSHYERDIQLIAMEREAWDNAKVLAMTYDHVIDEGIIVSHLDTYRDWLHARSSCPSCNAVGHQIKKQLYHCSACRADWRVNEARLCGLKRYVIQKTPLI